MSVPSNPYVSPDRWEDMPWEEYDQPDLVTTMILYRKYRTALEEISKMDGPAGRIAREAL